MKRRAACCALGLAAVLAPVLAQAADPASTPRPQATARPALTVTVTQARRAEIATGVQAGGNVAAWQEAVIGAEGGAWRLADVRVNVGDTVRRGQVLAVFAAELARAELAQGAAAVVEAEATLAEAAANAQRARDLQPSGALSAQQINQALTAERTAQARLDALRAGLTVQELRLAQTQVRAPDHGVISSRSATVGAVVPPGTELFRLIRQGRLEWRAELPADALAQLKPGQAARVGAPGGATLTGKLRMVAPTVDAATRNGLVYVDLLQTGALKPGMYARGEFETGRSSGLTLPQSAVLLRDGRSLVFRLGADQRVAQTPVGVGRRVGDRIEITTGLDANTRVVASGVGFLADGDTVRVVDAAPAAPAAPATAK